MYLVAEYREAQRYESVCRLRRVLSLRAMVVAGMSQRQIAEALDITQPAVSQQLKYARELGALHPETMLAAAAPILKVIAANYGYRRLAAFGSVARGQARQDSDIDLLVESPPGTSSFDFIRFKRVIEQALGREVDMVDYGGLKPGIDDDIRREAVLL
ncbi:MAG: nucleotidyltransferase domain-containing protein [Dermatophilaceae bacterium]